MPIDFRVRDVLKWPYVFRLSSRQHFPKNDVCRKLLNHLRFSAVSTAAKSFAAVISSSTHAPFLRSPTHIGVPSTGLTERTTSPIGRVALLGWVHLRVEFAVLIMGRTGRIDQRGIDVGTLTQRQAMVTQITIHEADSSGRQLVLLQQKTEV